MFGGGLFGTDGGLLGVDGDGTAVEDGLGGGVGFALLPSGLTVPVPLVVDGVEGAAGGVFGNNGLVIRGKLGDDGGLGGLTVPVLIVPVAGGAGGLILLSVSGSAVGLIGSR